MHKADNLPILFLSTNGAKDNFFCIFIQVEALYLCIFNQLQRLFKDIFFCRFNQLERLRRFLIYLFIYFFIYLLLKKLSNFMSNFYLFCFVVNQEKSCTINKSFFIIKQKKKSLPNKVFNEFFSQKSYAVFPIMSACSTCFISKLQIVALIRGWHFEDESMYSRNIVIHMQLT